MGAACCNEKNASQQETVSRPAEPTSAAAASTDNCCTIEKEGCNEVCIKTAAAIMCQNDVEGHEMKSTSTNGSPACETHLRRAMNKYQAFLDSALCICRDMMSQGMRATCCSTSTDQQQGPTLSFHRLESDSVGISVREDKNKLASTATIGEIHGRHDEHDHAGDQDKHDGKHSHGGCCSSSETATKSPTIPKNVQTFRDMEKGGAGIEHMTILVSGMTCSGCGDQLKRALATTNGVDNVTVNFMQGRAGFTLQPGKVDVNELLRKTQGVTGFEISMFSEDETIQVLLLKGSSVRDLAQQLVDVDGVGDVTAVTKTCARIHYDPFLIGARDLVDKAMAGGLCTGLAPPETDKQLTAGHRRFLVLLYQTIAATVLTIPVLTLAWGVDDPHLSLGVVNKHIRSIISLILASLVQLLSIPVFYAPALKALVRYRVFELDMLVVMSITAAYVYSVVAFGYSMAGNPLQTGQFFETSTLLVTLIMLGRLVASYARNRAVGAVSLRGLQVETAMLVVSVTGTLRAEAQDGAEDGSKREEVKEIDARLLQLGDHFKVLPHSRVPTDGIVLSGLSEVDEAMLTGESLPVTKSAGAAIAAGTINGSGTLVVRLTRLPSSNTVADIAQLVEEAGSSKPRVQELADRVAGWFLPVVLGVAAVVLVVWAIVGVKVLEQSAGEAVSVAVTYVVAVLAVSCPCALGLAVPMVLVIANGIAARGGVVIKAAGTTERARKVTDVVFDKTGTLTEPDLDVVAEEYFGNDPEEMRAILLALVKDSKHPVSTAIAKHITSSSSAVKVSPSVDKVQSIPGMGIEGVLSGNVTVRAGSPSWALGPNGDFPRSVDNMLCDGQSILALTVDSVPSAIIGLRTRLRPNAKAIISSLSARNITVHLVSGDQIAAVYNVAQTLGIDTGNVAAQQTPQEKQVYVSALMNKNKTSGNNRNRVVMFCGDGTNDAPAVAQADIGVQLVGDSLSASDVTRSAADVILLAGLEGILSLLDISRAAFARIVFNFAWSAVYNVLAILLAAGAFVEIRIAPAYAGAGEMVSVLPVIGAALSMLLVKVRV